MWPFHLNVSTTHAGQNIQPFCKSQGRTDMKIAAVNRGLGSHNFETIIKPSQFLCDEDCRVVAPFLRNVRMQTSL
jgi:hypothetical protein